MIFKESIIVSVVFLSFIFISCGGTVSNKPTCGNGIIDSFETCDKDQVDCTDLDSTKYKSGKALCNNTCDNYDTSGCNLTGSDICGNNIIEGNEACDKDQVDCSALDSKYISGSALCKSDCSGYDILNCRELNQISKVMISVLTKTFNGHYSPRNVLAIWIEDSHGKYIKTLLVKAMARKSRLSKWFSVSNMGMKGIMVDTITSATRRMHQTETLSWNLKDSQNNRIADGEYTIWFELNEGNGASKKNSAKIQISNNPSIINIGSSPYFQNIGISFE